VEVPANTPFPWHWLQEADRWAPVNLNAVVLWSNDAGRHDDIEWQARHSVENPACRGDVAAAYSC
jgi:hypothetical protein